MYKTKSIIYLIEFCHCGKQYVGKTEKPSTFKWMVTTLTSDEASLKNWRQLISMHPDIHCTICLFRLLNWCYEMMPFIERWERVFGLKPWDRWCHIAWISTHDHLPCLGQRHRGYRSFLPSTPYISRSPWSLLPDVFRILTYLARPTIINERSIDEPHVYNWKRLCVSRNAFGIVDLSIDIYERVALTCIELYVIFIW